MTVHSIKVFKKNLSKNHALLRQFKYPHQAKNFYISRNALKLTLADLIPETKIADLDELKILEHHRLKNFPNIIVSLSHSGEIGAAIAGLESVYNGLGIDIESQQREIKKGMEKYYLNLHDEDMPLLNLWCLKEAAFKALSPIINEYPFDTTKNRFLLKNIWIKDNQFGLVGHKQIIGTCNITQIEQYLLATAFIPSS
jgi:phosphopantetheinyl transferase (holo-ACP synthase)